MRSIGNGRHGGRPLRTQAPRPEQECQVEWPDLTITIEVRRASFTRAPTAQKLRQVGRANCAVAIEIGVATVCIPFLKLIRAHIHDWAITSTGIRRKRVINEARVAVEVQRDRLIRIAVIVEVGRVGGDGGAVGGVDARRAELEVQVAPWYG